MVHKEQLKHINRKVAITVAALSTFLAVSKVKDDNIVQAMMQAQSNAMDTWNQYQAKKIREAINTNTLHQNEAIQALLPKRQAAAMQEMNRDLRSNIARYQQEQKELALRAKEFEERYQVLNDKDDQFDLSDACLSLGLMMLAVTALTGQEALLWGSWAISALGLLFGTAGFAGWNFKPDWLMRLLS